MNQTKKKHTVESLFVLIIFAIFMVTSLMIVMIGANVYRGVVADTDANNALRSSCSYIANKVRSADSADAVHVTEINGIEALTIDADYGEESFRTYIYYHEGYLKESFVLEDQPFSPDFGEKVIQVDRFQMQQDGTLLTFSAASDEVPELSLKLNLSA